MQAFAQLSTNRYQSQAIGEGGGAFIDREQVLWLRDYTKPLIQFTRVELPERVIQASADYERTPAFITESGYVHLRNIYCHGRGSVCNVHTYRCFVRVQLPARAVQLSFCERDAAIVTEDGRLWLWTGHNSPTDSCRHFKHVILPSSAFQASVSTHRVMAITECGQLWAYGHNHKGQLGVGDTWYRNTFTRVELPDRVKQVVAGDGHTALISDSGQLWLCGDNTRGRLGLGLHRTPHCTRFSRVTITGERVLQVSIGDHSAMVTESGQVWTCGRNSSGQLGLGCNVAQNVFRPVELSERVKYVSVGKRATLMVTDNGDLWVCGRYDYSADGHPGSDNVFTRVELGVLETRD